MPHVVLLGDSIFDNGAYVPGEPDVIAQLRSLLPETWRATLCAVDGAVVAYVRQQIPRVPADATHLVLSAGGNDALSHLDLLEMQVTSSAEVLDELAAVGEDFEQRYRNMLEEVLSLDLPVAICTIYNGRMPDAPLQRRAQTALTVFNDVITRSAAFYSLPYIELRHVCTAPGDYANPIEPSVQGGQKIASAIVSVLTTKGGWFGAEPT